MIRQIKKRIAYYYLKKKYPIRIASTDRTLKAILDGKSISRFGDGEFFLIEGSDECYQRCSEDLRTQLGSILVDDRHNDNCIIGIPLALNSLRGLTPRSKEFWVDYVIGHRKMIFSHIDPKMQYYDAQVTRAYINKRDKQYSRNLFTRWQKLWEGKDVLVVEGEKTRFGAGNDLLSNAKSVRRIICPSVDAYEKINLITDAILKVPDVDLCLLALGPTASELSYKLSQKSIQAIDIGNLDIEYEWCLKNAAVMTAVKGKYTCEAIDGTDGRMIDDIEDPVYQKQIIEVIL